MAKMLHDAQVAVDLLAAQDDVDRDRLAAVGHSLGAKEALYLAAFDPRIRCTVASEGGIGMRFSNWDAPWYLGPEMHRGLVGHEHHELLAMAAPRAFLLVGGGTPNEGVGAKGADGDRSWPFVAEALKVYRLFDQRPKLGLYNHHQGHSVPSDAAKRIYEWLLAYV
jgi:pimeloyl-ACP methyl ester carboxylesterase